jgi:phosphonopyruvate decarboxylase
VIRAHEFIEPARARGFDWYAGVPCSFLTPFINYVIDDDRLSYLSAANEGDAVAAAVGAVLGGRHAVVMMQNSGLGNAVNPLTSLAHPFRIPLLLIVTWRGNPDLADEPQHALMGAITGRLLEDMGIPWAYFPTDPDDIEPLLERAATHMRRERRPFALLMRKGTVAAHTLQRRGLAIRSRQGPAQHRDWWRPPGTPRAARSEALERIVEHTPEQDTVVIATTGYTGRELFALADRPHQLYMVGSMGCAASIGLGLALTRPDRRVVVIDGDGAALMRMGSLATAGAYAGPNLYHLVLDNEAHDSTGGQATVSPGIRFTGVADACGYEVTLQGDDPALVEHLLGTQAHSGPAFGHLKIRTGTRKDLPRPSRTPEQLAERLMTHLGTQ